MTTPLIMANMAVGLLRETDVTSVTSDTSNAGLAVAKYYSHVANDCLTRYPWSFATKKTLLVVGTAPLNEYTYGHTLPDAVLRLWALTTSTAVGERPITDYDIQQPGSDRIVNSNYATLYADHTYYVSEAYWPAYFVEFFHKALAAKLAIPITDQAELAGFWKQEAWGTAQENELGGAFGIACRIDSLQKPGEHINSDPLNEARFS